MRTNTLSIHPLGLLLALSLSVAACGGEEEVTTAAEAEHDEHAEHASTGPAQLPTLPDGASVSFGEPAAGTVRGPLTDGKVQVHVVMQASELTVMPAGELQDGAGHHHILIDPEGGEGVPRGTAVPADDTHIHYGGGQTEADLMLTPGPHVLMLQFADGAHRSYGAALTARVEIVVEAAEDATAGEAEAEDEAESESEDAAE